MRLTLLPFLDAVSNNDSALNRDFGHSVIKFCRLCKTAQKSVSSLVSMGILKETPTIAMSSMMIGVVARRFNPLVNPVNRCALSVARDWRNKRV